MAEVASSIIGSSTQHECQVSLSLSFLSPGSLLLLSLSTGHGRQPAAALSGRVPVLGCFHNQKVLLLQL